VWRPTFRALDAFECTAILAMHHVGRLAFAVNDRPDIQPIHYVFADGAIYGRTSDGAKRRALTLNRWVAFEVDEVDAAFVWRSIVVKGALSLLTPDDDGPLHGEWERGVVLLQRVVPEAFTVDDPTPERSIIFRIHIDEVTGRAALL
jgi:nitroimidazol reductase NimA-like FMN-containing flavoprotein (pyridoxamine 5'-phosphate oxidase superfamily)